MFLNAIAPAANGPADECLSVSDNISIAQYAPERNRFSQVFQIFTKGRFPYFSRLPYAGQLDIAN